MQPRQGVFQPVLSKVIANGHLTAKTVAAVADRHLLTFIVERMDEDRDIKAGPAERVGHGAFVAKVWQCHQYAIDFFAMGLKQVGAFLCFGQRFHRSETARFDRQRDHLDVFLFENAQNIAPAGFA